MQEGTTKQSKKDDEVTTRQPAPDKHVGLQAEVKATLDPEHTKVATTLLSVESSPQLESQTEIRSINYLSKTFNLQLAKFAAGVNQAEYVKNEDGHITLIPPDPQSMTGAYSEETSSCQELKQKYQRRR